MVEGVPRVKDQSENGKVAVTVELPADIFRVYGTGRGKAGRHLLEHAAVEGYRSGELSGGQVSRILRLEWEETQEFLAKHRCYRHYSQGDLEVDRKNIGKIFGTR